MTAGVIRGVLFDMGGTLEDIFYDDDTRRQATEGMIDILRRHGIDPGLPAAELYPVIMAGIRSYMDWREESERELPPEQVWPEYVFANRAMPREQLEAAAEELAFHYDTRFYQRTLRPEVPDLLAALQARGLRLAVISNIFSRGQVTHNLAAYGIDCYFQAVILSSCFGWRKPNKRIFLEGARLLRLPPAACAYVGDTVSRDVVGAHRAGYALAIQIKSFLTGKSDRATDTEPPDAVVENLMDVVRLVAPEEA